MDLTDGSILAFNEGVLLNAILLDTSLREIKRYRQDSVKKVFETADMFLLLEDYDTSGIGRHYAYKLKSSYISSIKDYIRGGSKRWL